MPVKLLRGYEGIKLLCCEYFFSNLNVFLNFTHNSFYLQILVDIVFQTVTKFIPRYIQRERKVTPNDFTFCNV